MNDYSPVKQSSSVPTGPIVTGATLIVIGIGWLLSALEIATIPWRALLAAILIVVGVSLVAIAPGRSSPGALPAAGIALVLVLAMMSTVSAAFSVPLRGGVGDRDYRPTSLATEAEYHLIAGQIDLELGDVDFPAGETNLEVGVTFGKIVIEDIPADVAVTVDASAAAGKITLFGGTWEGVNIDAAQTDGHPELALKSIVIDARVAFGEIEVRR